MPREKADEAGHASGSGQPNEGGQVNKSDRGNKSDKADEGYNAKGGPKERGPWEHGPGEGGPATLTGFGRYAGPATLILSSLADGVKHGYALTKDIEEFAGVRLAPGTLYEALARLDAQGLIEPVETDDRRRPYRLTAAGATALRASLKAQRAAANAGLHRLDIHWRLT